MLRSYSGAWRRGFWLFTALLATPLAAEDVTKPRAEEAAARQHLIDSRAQRRLVRLDSIRLALGDSAAGQAPPNRVIHDLLERTTLTMGLFSQHTCDIRIERQRGSH